MSRDTDFTDRNIHRINYRAFGNKAGYFAEVGCWDVTAIKAVRVPGWGGDYSWFDIYHNDELVQSIPPWQITSIIYKEY